MDPAAAETGSVTVRDMEGNERFFHMGKLSMYELRTVVNNPELPPTERAWKTIQLALTRGKGGPVPTIEEMEILFDHEAYLMLHKAALEAAYGLPPTLPQEIPPAAKSAVN